MPASGPIPAYHHPDTLALRLGEAWLPGGRSPHPDVPERVTAIIEALTARPDDFELRTPPPLAPELFDVHAPGMWSLFRAAQRLADSEEVHPKVFQGRALERRHSTVDHVGDWAIDARSPLTRHVLPAAKAAARCAFGAARALGPDTPLTYALCRPGGHHAGPDSFGGHSYVNHAAIAASALRGRGSVTVLDIGAHHGNGTQAIFYERTDVQVVSIHETPATAFPYTTGEVRELGRGDGLGRNLNLPQPAGCDGAAYLEVLDGHALPAIRSFAPTSLVLSAGVDIHADDPTGSFSLTTDDLREVGLRIGRLGVPVVAVQEGGYDVARLGQNVLALLDGLREGLARAPSRAS